MLSNTLTGDALPDQSLMGVMLCLGETGSIKDGTHRMNLGDITYDGRGRIVCQFYVRGQGFATLTSPCTRDGLNKLAKAGLCELVKTERYCAQFISTGDALLGMWVCRCKDGIVVGLKRDYGR